MIEIVNKTKSPVQLLVRSRKAPRSFTTLIVPGIGKGKNVKYIQDEMATDYIKRVEHDMKLISTRYIPNNEIRKGD